MSTFRKTAMAGATALAVAFGSTSIATAQENPTAEVGNSNISSQLGAQLDANPSDHSDAGNFADGTALFGSSKGAAENEEAFEAQPAWAQLLYGGTVFAGVAAIVGLVVGPLYNFIVHGPLFN